MARTHHQRLIREVVRMLCAGVVHGDLSEYDILIGSDGPVIIALFTAAGLMVVTVLRALRLPPDAGAELSRRS